MNSPLLHDELSTLVELLRWRAFNQPKQQAYTFLLDGEAEEQWLTYGELDRQARAVAALLQHYPTKGARALLLYPPGLDYIAAFFGCLYAGITAAPAHPPQFNRSMRRLQSIASDAQATLVLTTTSLLPNLERWLTDSPELKIATLIATDDTVAGMEDNWQEPLITRDTLAFLQYTSGSTAAPKGVMVSHANLMHNERLIRCAFEHQPQSTRVVGWLPLYHDMGLIGNVLQPLYVGAPCILMAPVAFLQKPCRWLEAISRYQATTSGGPNFAYDLCVRRVSAQQRETLDLSGWTVAFNGSEPIRYETLERFAAAFEPCGFRREAFYPCYGMAETTLIVSGGCKASPPVLQTVQRTSLEQNQVIPNPSKGDDGYTLVSSGRPLANLQIVIAHPKRLTRCADDEIGEIWVAGASIAQGYWRRPKATETVFKAYLADTGEGPFLRTGDLGFLKEGELYVTGRLKDLIIIRGRNHYPQDIELTVEQSHPALRSGCGAAFSVDKNASEQLVVVQELERSALRRANADQVIGAIRQAVTEQHELQVYAVLLLKTGSIPKTSSGKIQRYACRAGFLDGGLAIVGSSISADLNIAASDVKLTCEMLQATPPEQRQTVLERFLQNQVTAFLKLPHSQVGLQQPLNTLGLDSLRVVELKHNLEMNLGVTLPLTTLFQDSTTLAQLTTDIFTQLTTSQAHLHLPTLPQENDAEYPLSYGQQALWFLQNLTPQSSAYNIVSAVRIRSPLNIPALQRAFQTLVSRHTSLRTRFTNVRGEPMQQVYQQVNLLFQPEDVANWSEAALRDRLTENANRPFNLEQESALRVSLFTRSAQDHTLLLVMHHIGADFWSLAVLAQELGILYQAEMNGAQANLAPVTLQYADYVRWQTGVLTGPEGERLWTYWQTQLAGEIPALNLPIDRPRSPVQTYQGASHACKLSPALTQQLKAFSRTCGTTLYTTLLAAFQVLLYRYSGQADVWVGSPTAGRTRSEFTKLVGYLVNPIVLRADLSGNPTFEKFLIQVRQTVQAALAHQDFPFAQLVERLQPVRDASRSPLFQVMFVLQTLPAPGGESLAPLALGEARIRLKLGELALESIALEQRTAQFDLTLMMAEVEGQLSASWQYNSDLFDAATIVRMANHFQILLTGIIDDSQQPISTLPLLTEAERYRQLVAWNDTMAAYPKAVCLHQLVEAQVERTPDAIAVVFEAEQLTYRQLNGRANQLARHLQALGVGPDVLVGVCMERSIDMVVGLLSILKAGGAYAPLDPTYPSARLAFMLQDTQVSVLLTQDWLLGVLPEHTAHTLCLNQGWHTLKDEADDNLTNSVTAEHLAYVIYTSGSTGAPKGVMNTHQGICNRLLWMQDTYQLTIDDRVLQKTPFSFDVSVWEFFWTLMTGARLIIARPGGHQDSAYLAKVIAAEKITTVHFVPSMLSLFLEEPGLQSCHHLRQVMCSGEALSLSLQERFFAHLDAALHNLYGPTEAAIDVTFWACQRESLRPIVPIGRPIANTQIYLLDAQLQPVPVGVPGELHIGGIGLARGYLNRPNLTTEKFIPNPYRDEPDARLYKTGDLARYLPDGEIEYLGRIDHQVKVRGCRIELGEIEAALGRHANLQAAIVLVREPESHKPPAQVNLITDFEDTPITELRRFLKGTALVRSQPADKQLVAYCVARQQPAPTTTELRRFLKETLPDFMVPSIFVLLDTLPLTANGKVNRRALPSPDQARPDLEKAFVAPRAPAETVLAEVWAQVLGLEKVGIHDNFFELGGDSIRSIQVKAKAQERGFHFELEQLFQHQTIATLAPELTVVEPRTLSTQKTQAFSLISLEERQQLPVGIEDAYPLGKTQAGVIFHSQAAPDSPMYRDIFQYHLQVCFNASLFESAVQQVVDRHPILRTSFDLATFSAPLQLVHQTVHVPLHVEDLRAFSPVQQTGLIADWIKTEQSRPFDWSHPPLIRFFIHRLTDVSFYLTLSFHDCILDGWSTSSLLTELLHRYCALLKGEAIPLVTPPQVSFRDFVALEQSMLASVVCQDYWTRKLNDCIIRSLPRWNVSTPKANAPEMGVLHVEVLPQVSDGLKALARLAQVPVKHVLLAAHVRVMSLLTGESDVLTGLESNGRLEELEAEQTLGIHLNTAPFRLKLAAGTWIELAQQVFEAERELLPFRRYPYSELKKLKGGDHLFETVFNYTHFHVYEQLRMLKELEILGAQGFGETHFTFRAEFNQNHASGQIQLDLECDLTQIGNAQLEAIGAHYSQALTSMANQPFTRYETECLLSERERHQLLVEWNKTKQDYPLGCIHHWFEDQVARQPNAIALIWENECLSYQDLNHRANALAHYLQELGVHSDVPVALCVERSPDMIVGVLGILKAGGAYVPLDPTYPQDHLKFILEDVNAPIILTQMKVSANLPASNAQIVCLDSDWSAIAQESPDNPIPITTPAHLAYIIYTSGSTGRPKGVLISHQSLVNSTSARITCYSEPVTRFLLVPSIAFDSSVAGIFWTLCQGGALVLFPEGCQKEIWRLATLIDQHKVSHWLSVPSLYKVLLAQADPSQLSSLKTVIVAGEACSGELIERHQELLPETTLFNEYGPTEGTVWSSVYQVQTHELSPVIPIGRPIANTQIYLLDPYLQPVPIGVAGELYIAGLGIAKGYLNRPELTAEMFIPNPFNRELGARLYKTGDLARYRPDGDLEFLGRVDHQVKLRGYRIELTAIEAILKQHPHVEEAVAWVKAEASGGQQLIAYVLPTPGSMLTTDKLQSFLRHKSPSYMIPNVFAILDTLPLTSSGKVDRQRLPALEQVQSASGTMARLLEMLEHLSDNEAKAMLAQNRRAN